MNSDYSSDDDKNGEESLIWQDSYNNPIIIFSPEVQYGRFVAKAARSEKMTTYAYRIPTHLIFDTDQ